MWREWTFWLLLAGVAYTYAGYPTLLWLASQVRRAGRSRVAERPYVRDLPRVSIVVPSSDRPEVLAQPVLHVDPVSLDSIPSNRGRRRIEEPCVKWSVSLELSPSCRMTGRSTCRSRRQTGLPRKWRLRDRR